MKISIDDRRVDDKDSESLDKLIDLLPSKKLENVKDLWFLMDSIWDEIGCDNENININKLGEFYSHPIWVLNGLFTEQDKVSVSHRKSIAEWVLNNNIESLVSYGGGFGFLENLIVKNNNKILVDIYEPYPNRSLIERFKCFDNVLVINKLEKKYDCLVSIDVLEHVEDPLVDFSEMIKHVNDGGYLIIANCFYPVIKCHLPRNFHFRFTFNIFAKLMGLKVVGLLEGGHATIFKKRRDKKVNWFIIRFFEFLSKALFPLIDGNKNFFKKFKNLAK
jgi:hypothetical protein